MKLNCREKSRWSENSGERSEARSQSLRLPPSGLPPSALRHPASDLRPATSGLRESGVALVITLIMLSVITFMTVAFLVLSQRERHSVTGLTDQTIARFATETAKERALAELIGSILSNTNRHAYGLIVSTNYVNPDGFDPTYPLLPAGSNPYTNVNFSYTYALTGPAGRPLTAEEQLRNQNNLLYNPRVQVVRSNRITGQIESLFYLDLNRNGRFDTNGILPVRTPSLTTPYYDSDTGNMITTLTNALRSRFTGDPEWIGILEFPDRPHSSSNRFIARIAYLVVPASKTLDVNFVHNYARQLPDNMKTDGFDGFSRDQGVGSFEINLGAFFTDLNTNIWQTNSNPYQYFDANLTLWNQGAGFDDALAMLRYRYQSNFHNLVNPFPGVDSVNIDEYANGTPAGTIMTGNTLNDDNNDINDGYPGADNLRHFQTPQEFFDPTKSSGANPSLVTRLRQAGNGISSYDVYTYYRLLESLGTDSAPERGKINLNYVNVDADGNVVPDMQTNLIPWTPLQLFTNAARAMFAQMRLRDAQGNPITVTNIPIFPPTNNFYTPTVHRILQLAANLYDATTNQTVPLRPGQTNSFVPSVFKPIFRSQGGVVSIIGFEEVTDLTPLSDPFLSLPDVSTVDQVNRFNMYGVPWIIGAKKGLPNFNVFTMNTIVSMGRKLRLDKTPPITRDSPVVTTRQLYSMTISNLMGLQAWNSYAAAWPSDRPLEIRTFVDFSLILTNELGQAVIPASLWRTNFSFSTNFTTATWGGYDTSVARSSLARSTIIPFMANFYVLSNATYRASTAPQTFISSHIPINNQFELPTTVPQWKLVMTKRMRFIMIDTSVNRVIDFVNLESANETIDLTAVIMAHSQCPPAYPGTSRSAYWCTNRITGAPYAPGANMMGINFQIGVSQGSPALSENEWASAGADLTRRSQTDSFADFLNGNDPTNSFKETPFNPSVTTNSVTSWEANDPLVHYTIDDLTDRKSTHSWIFPRIAPNPRYHPWGYDNSADIPDPQNIIAKKDSQLFNSDGWAFPTNRFPNIGTMGRVHRGTPWQTVYMKSPAIAVDQWSEWIGTTNGFVSRTTAPTNDWRLFDLFTTAVNDNVTRGQMSVNQNNLAAWSAVLSGVPVYDTNGTPVVIQPAGVDRNGPLGQIVNGINRTRGNTIYDGSFRNLGDILSVPELTTNSPFLDLGRYPQNDEAVERIPQQIMSLLTLDSSPRFVIYAYGQTLHPAEGRSVVTGGPYAGLCTNYQVTAESATRIVVRVEGSPNPRDNDADDPPLRRYPPRVIIEQFNPLPPD